MCLGLVATSVLRVVRSVLRVATSVLRARSEKCS